MKLSPFTLIYQPEREIAERQFRRDKTSKSTRKTLVDQNVQDVRKKAPGLVRALNSLSPNLSRTLIASTYAQKAVAPKERVKGKLERVLSELRQSKAGVTVALWDLDAKIGGISQLIGAINKGQPVFTFFELLAPVPAGLVVRSDGFKQWALRRFGKRVTKRDEQDFQDNLLFDDFYKFARVVREQIGVDYLVGITQQMVAWQGDGEIYWNYFSTYSGQVILSSAYNMPKYAKDAGRPLEVGIAGIVIPQILQILNKRVRYHQNRGCLFDYNEERETIVETIKKTEIEERCLSRLDEKYREATKNMIKVLSGYSPKREEVETQKHSKPSKSQKDDEYWLAQLIKLSKQGGKSRGAAG